MSRSVLHSHAAREQSNALSNQVTPDSQQEIHPMNRKREEEKKMKEKKNRLIILLNCADCLPADV